MSSPSQEKMDKEGIIIASKKAPALRRNLASAVGGSPRKPAAKLPEVSTAPATSAIQPRQGRIVLRTRRRWRNPCPFRDRLEFVAALLGLVHGRRAAGLDFERDRANAFMPSRMVEEVHDMVREGGQFPACTLLPGTAAAPPRGAPVAFGPARERAWVVRNTSTPSTGPGTGRLAVVLHPGAVLPPAPPAISTLDRRRGGGRRVTCGKRENTPRPGKRKSPYLRAVRKSLEELVPAARSAGVRLGMETRYFPGEIPIWTKPEELWDGWIPGRWVIGTTSGALPSGRTRAWREPYPTWNDTVPDWSGCISMTSREPPTTAFPVGGP